MARIRTTNQARRIRAGIRAGRAWVDAGVGPFLGVRFAEQVYGHGLFAHAFETYVMRHGLTS